MNMYKRRIKKHATLLRIVKHTNNSMFWEKGIISNGKNEV